MSVSRHLAATIAAVFLLSASSRVAAADIWDLARSKQAVHRFSTLMTAQDVRDRLATDTGIDEAQRWCRETGVTKAYIESFRDGYRAPPEGLCRATSSRPTPRCIFLSVHALKDPDLATKLAAYVATGRPVLLTDGLAKRLEENIAAGASNVHVLPVKGDPKGLLGLPQATLDALRAPLLEPLSRHFEAPNRVALYLFHGGSWVVENFNDDCHLHRYLTCFLHRYLRVTAPFVSRHLPGFPSRPRSS